MITLVGSFINIFLAINKSIAHSRFDAKIIRFFIPAVFAITDNMVFGLQRSIEKTTNLNIIFS